MTSQVSTRKLLLQEIRQSGWMFGLTALLHFLTGPVVFLLSTSNYANWTDTNASYRFHDFFTNVFSMWQIFVIVVCICISIFTYKYLFSKRMVDLYHSVPIGRGQLFLVKYLHGLLIWLIPFLSNVLCVLLLFLIRTFGKQYMLSCIGTLGQSILLLLLIFLIFYHLFLVAVYLSGNVLNMFTNAAVIGCSALCIMTLYFSYANTYFETYCTTPSMLLMDIIYSISPLAAPFALEGYFACGELSEHIPLIILSIPVSLGLLGVAWILCLKRPSELAERGTISKKYTIPARIIVAFIAGTAGALFFSEIASGTATLAWGIFGAVLCSIFSFGAINSVFLTTIKYFFRHKKQMLITALVSMGIVLIFQLDLLGYDTYMPDKEDIAGMAIYSGTLTDDSAHLVLRNGNLIYDRTANVVQTELLTDTDLCYEMLGSFLKPEEEGGYTSVYAKIKLKSGYTYERRYRLPYAQYTALAPFVENEAYKSANYKFSTGEPGYPNDVTVELWNAAFDLQEGETKELFDAYRADFEEHYNLEELSSYMEHFSISGTYGSGEGNRWFTLDIPDNYSRTISLLTEWYPEYSSLPASAAEIKEINMNLHSYTNYNEYDYTLETLYNHFGYDASETISSDLNTDSEETIETTDTEVVEIADNSGVTYPTAEKYGVYYYTINDDETLEKLYPLLTFGQYRDHFSRKEYIYVGDATIGNYSMNCYVKPGTIPKEIIEEMYEATKNSVEQ